MTIRVLIADDSELFVEALRDSLEVDAQLQVIGVARHGEDAVEMTLRLRPDIITMDVEMPKLGGLDAVERIMSARPTPILVLTADPRSINRSWAFDALHRGALDLWPKPTLTPETEAEQQALREHIKLLASVPVLHHAKRKAPREPGRVVPTALPSSALPGVVGIVSSTGGPSVLAELLAGLPPTFPLGIVIVQHLAEGFAAHFVTWLASTSPFKVALATDGALVEPGTVWIAPDGAHARVNARGRISLDASTPPFEGNKPAGTILLSSLAESFGPRAIGAVLTGMGRDGSAGLLAIHQAGGATLAQDAETSTIFGMPKAALELGATRLTVPRQRIAATLSRLAGELVGGRPWPS